MTIHPVVTATSSAASTAAMNAPSITGLLLHVVPGLLLLVAASVAVLSGLVFESPPVVDIAVTVTRLQVHVVVLR